MTLTAQQILDKLINEDQILTQAGQIKFFLGEVEIIVKQRDVVGNIMQDLYDAKLSAYTLMKTVASQTGEFVNKLNEQPKTENDKIDNQLLCELYSRRADILITEDRRLRNKAIRLGLENSVFSIDAFISKCASENPELLDYKVLSVKKIRFGEIDVKNPFFDTFREPYKDFEGWFAKKCDEEAYICRNEKTEILGFLYLKTEDEQENYSDITPTFEPKRRLKIGTFKVESTGFRLGERFIKIIFDNAIERRLDEIYVTMFLDRPELKALYDLLLSWGFYYHGTKNTFGKKEHVLVKKIGNYDCSKSVINNFPSLHPKSDKYILPIFPEYHTNLFPDSILYNEKGIDLVENIAHRYAIQKAYITWAKCLTKPGDILLFYRTGESYPKKYSSVLTTIGVVVETVSNFKNEDEFLTYCQNRTVFSINDLKSFWRNHRYNLSVLKFVYVKSLQKRLTLGYLWEKGIVIPPNGPRSFTKLTDQQFNMIIQDSKNQI